jgi:hypothetical protein
LILKASRKGRCQFDAYQTDAEPSLAVKYQFRMSLMSHQRILRQVRAMVFKQAILRFAQACCYWINFAHTAKYKSNPHAIAINTNQIAILPNDGRRA